MPTTFAPDDTLHLTNLTKVFWPEQGYTKGDLVNYYREIAPVILRTSSTVRRFCIATLTVRRPRSSSSASAGSARLGSPSWDIVVNGRKPKTFHRCQKWPALLWLANFGCIEFDPCGLAGAIARPPGLPHHRPRPSDVPFSRCVEVP